MVVSWVDIAEEMVDMFSKKKSTSPDKISRSESGICPLSWAVMSSIMECSSDGRSAALEDRSESVRIMI